MSIRRAEREGYSVADISAQLHLAQGTVRNYLSSAITKLHATNRTEAARIAEERGWL
jgi:two-component system, NarL family, response regulator DesR